MRVWKNYIPTDIRFATITPEPIHDVFPIRCEGIFETKQGATLDVVAQNDRISKIVIMQYNRFSTDEIPQGAKLLIPLYSNMPRPTATPIE